MTIETVTCARCGDRVPLDVDHGKVQLDTIRMDDLNGRNDYVLCLDCTTDLRDEWRKPA